MSRTFAHSSSGTVSIRSNPLNLCHFHCITIRDLVYVISASIAAQLVKNSPVMQEIPDNFWVGKICWRRDRLPTPVFFGFPGDSTSKESPWNAGILGLILGFGRSPGEGNG